MWVLFLKGRLIQKCSLALHNPLDPPIRTEGINLLLAVILYFDSSLKITLVIYTATLSVSFGSKIEFQEIVILFWNDKMWKSKNIENYMNISLILWHEKICMIYIGKFVKKNRKRKIYQSTSPHNHFPIWLGMVKKKTVTM